MQHYSAASYSQESRIQTSLARLLAETFSTSTQLSRSPFEIPLHGFVIHSKETKLWATALAAQLTRDFGWLYPDSKLTLEALELNDTNEHIQSALSQCPTFWDKKKARFSFALTPGYQASHLISDIRHRSPSVVPQLYCVPGTLPLSRSLDDSLMGGIHNTPMAATEYIDALKGLLPGITKVCLAYTQHPEKNTEASLQKTQRAAFAAACMRANIALVEHTWDHDTIYPQGLEDTLTEVDALITLDEPAMHKHRHEVIQLCNRLKKPLCASELDSVYAGAALGCGITATAFSKPLLRTLTDILLETTDIKSRSRAIPMQDGMRYNIQGLLQQGVVLDDSTLALVRMKSVFDTDAMTL
jgi:ABC-type uncharacterized transport system substrate-binding protein